MNFEILSREGFEDGEDFGKDFYFFEIQCRAEMLLKTEARSTKDNGYGNIFFMRSDAHC